MVLSANKLRIGNYFTQKGCNFIEQVSFETFDLLKRNTIYIEPIPLTEEWLLKFGFIKRYEDCFEHGKFILNDKFIMMDIDIHIDIKYIHQLQNLYFALTGEELILKA